MKGRERLSFSFLVVILILLYIPVQVVFILYYLFLAWKMCADEKAGTGLLLQLTLLNALAVPLGVWLTDRLFLTMMGKILLGLVGNQLVLYALWMTVQGFLLALIQIKGKRILERSKFN